jgi:GH15 family glucan-1,4-alpha-glucosidase
MGNLSLSDYGIIGNQTSSALISRLGSIAWCCMPYTDSPSCFGEILDSQAGGKFQIMPSGDFRSEQKYLQRTHVLETLFETPQGRGILTDWMPLESLSEDSEPMICRQIEVIDGTMNWTLYCQPRFNYATSETRPELHRDGILFRSGDYDSLAVLYASVPLEISEESRGAHARFQLRVGEKAKFSWIWGRKLSSRKFCEPKATIESWRAWAHRCPDTGCAFAGPWHDAVTRSGLTLKLLSSQATGAICESVTTSLPLAEGGGLNWDYRYSWIRNSAMTIQCLANLGYRAEAKDLFGWLMDIVRRDGVLRLQSVYSADGNPLISERELGNWKGFKDSKPIRVGNDSSHSYQLDIYGHVMMAACEYFKIAGELPRDVWSALSEIADHICHAWRRPDQGPWESRGPSQHFTVSKLMCWVALDRAAWLARVTGESGSPKWSEEAKILHKTICTQGFDEEQKSFVCAFGSREREPLALLIPMVRFLPINDPRVISTLAAIESNLSDGVLVRAPSGGASIAMSFLMTSCLALSGRVDEASDRLAELCSYATPLGFFSEQINRDHLQLSGNIPYAPAHVACINAALYIGMARGRQLPLKHLIGMPDQIVRSPGLPLGAKNAS